MINPVSPAIPLELIDLDPSIDCSRCAACCCRMPVLVMCDPLVPERYIEKDESGMTFMAQGEDGWCVALDRNTLRCTIYELRPQICRDFDMGGIDCQEVRALTNGN